MTDNLTHGEWECTICGSINSRHDFECQWCSDAAEDRDAIQNDHTIDHRKHNR